MAAARNCAAEGEWLDTEPGVYEMEPEPAPVNPTVRFGPPMTGERIEGGSGIEGPQHIGAVLARVLVALRGRHD